MTTELMLHGLCTGHTIFSGAVETQDPVQHSCNLSCERARAASHTNKKPHAFPTSRWGVPRNIQEYGTCMMSTQFAQVKKPHTLIRIGK